MPEFRQQDLDEAVCRREDAVSAVVCGGAGELIVEPGRLNRFHEFERLPANVLREGGISDGLKVHGPCEGVVAGWTVAVLLPRQVHLVGEGLEGDLPVSPAIRCAGDLV